MKSRYRCEFAFGERHLIAYSNCLDAFRDGFWIDVDLRYTNGTNVCYWIPPHRILFIAKDPDQQR